MSNSCPLLEVTFSEAPVVDRDAGVIRSVKILGRESRNNRVYSDAALNQAAYLYEGLAVNLDHPRPARGAGERSVVDGFGWLTAVGVRDAGVFGDLQFLRTHPQAPMIAEAAERNPRRFGLSHNAVGRIVQRDGQNVVESIDRVHSVDLVQNPATSQGLFESEHPARTLPLQALCDEARLPDLLANPLLESLRDRPVPRIDGADRTTLRAAVLTAVLQEIATLAAREPDLDHPALFRHLTEQLRDPGRPAAPRDLGDLLDRVARLEVDAGCRTLLELHNRGCDPQRLQALAALPSDEARRQLIESWPARDAGVRRRPGSSPPLCDRSDTPAKLPEDLRGFLAMVKTTAP